MTKKKKKKHIKQHRIIGIYNSVLTEFNVYGGTESEALQLIKTTCRVKYDEFYCLRKSKK